VVAALQTYLAAVGIRATVMKIPWSSLVESWRGGRLRFFVCGWLFDTGEGQSLFVDCLKSRDPKGAFGAFNPGYSSARLDKLIEQQSATLRRAERANLYRSLTLVTVEETPIVPLFTPMLSFSVPVDLLWKPRLDGKVVASEMAWGPS
jgi:ABC-type transport system substrate-binding protein